MLYQDTARATTELLDKAEDWEKAGHFIMVAYTYENLCRLHPGNVSFLFCAGLAWYARGKYQQSIPNFTEVLSRDPDHHAAMRLLASSLVGAEHNAEALEILNREVARFPYTADAWFEKGMAHRRLLQFDSAVPCFLKAAEITPKNPEIFENAIISLESCGRDAEAIPWYEHLVDLDPSRDDHRLRLVLTLVRLGRYEEAIRHCDESSPVRLTPSPPPNQESVFHNLRTFSRICLKRKDLPGPGLSDAERREEERQFERGIKNILYRELEEAQRILKWTQQKDIRSLGARELVASFVRIHDYYSRVLEQKPGNVCAHVRKGLSLMPLGCIDEALVCYNNALSIDPWSYSALKEKSVIFRPDTWEGIPGKGSRFSPDGPSGLTDCIHLGRWLALSGHWLDMTGDGKATDTWFMNLTVKYPENDDIWVVRGAVLKFLKKNVAEATQCFERALAINPRCTDAMIELGGYAAEKMDFSEAHAWFDRALALDPASRYAQRGKARVYREAGQHEVGCRCLLEFMKKNPEHAEFLLLTPTRSFSRDGAYEDALQRYPEILSNPSYSPWEVAQRAKYGETPHHPAGQKSAVPADGSATPSPGNAPAMPAAGLQDTREGDREDTRYSPDRPDPVSLAPGPDACTDPFRKGRLLALAGRREEALRCLDDLAAADRQPASYWVKRGGFVELNKIDPFGAIWCYERALAIDPECTEAMIALGAFYFRFTDFVRAHHWYDRALVADPSSILALEKKALAYEEAGMYDDAAACLEQCLRLDPSRTDLHEKFNQNTGIALIKPWPRRVLSPMNMMDVRVDPLKPPGYRGEQVPGIVFDEELTVFHNNFISCLKNKAPLRNLVAWYPNPARRYVAWSCSRSFISAKVFLLIREIGEELRRQYGDTGPVDMADERIRILEKKEQDLPEAGFRE